MSRPELTAAVDAVAAAVLQLRAGRPGGGEDEDEDEDGNVGVVKIELVPGQIASLFGDYPLTPVYREFLRAHSSHDFVDAGLRCGARAAWISAVHSVRELTALYQDSAGWAPHWLVCAVDQDGCYVVDLDAPRGDDCPVLYVPAAGKVQTVAPSFVGFLQQVARDSLGKPVREDRPRRPPPPGRVWAERQAAAPALADDRKGLVVTLLLAVLAAALLLWLR